jgi:hypothetical protein
LNTVIGLVHIEPDSGIAEQVRGDLKAAKYAVIDGVQPGTKALFVVVLSPQAVADRGVQQAIVDSLENNQQIIPVLAASVRLPRLIDHLQPLDYSETYEPNLLLMRIETLSAPGAPPPMKVLTPRVRASNRRAGLVVAVIVLAMFLAAIYMVAVVGVRAPAEEYAAVETEIILTRNYFIDGALPLSTQQAEAFPATLEAARTAVRVPLAETATAISEGVHFNFLPRTTAESAAFPLTLDALSTVVHEELIATATALAGEE